MDIIFIADRKEFYSITRNENLKYVQEHRNTIILTPDADIPKNIDEDIKLMDSNMGFSVKYISGSANVYSVGSVWVELKDIDGKLVKDNIKISLGTSTDYYMNLKVALETEKPYEYVDLMKDSLKRVSKTLNDEHGKDSEIYYGDYNFCIRLALFDDLYVTFTKRVYELDSDYMGFQSIEIEDDYEYKEYMGELVSDILDAENSGDKEKYEYLNGVLGEIDYKHQQYINSPEYKEKIKQQQKKYEYYLYRLKLICSKALEGIKENNTYYLACIANSEESMSGIKNRKYYNILETYKSFISNISWNSMSLNSFLEEPEIEKYFEYSKDNDPLLVFESSDNLSITKNSLVLVGPNGVGKSLFLDIIYKILSGETTSSSLSSSYLKSVHLKEIFVSVDVDKERTYKERVEIIPIFIENQIFDAEKFSEMFARVSWGSPEQIRLLFSVLDNDPLFSKLNLAQKVDIICSHLSQKFNKYTSWRKIFGVSGYYKYMEDMYKESGIYDFYFQGYRNLSDGQKRIIDIIVFCIFSLYSPKYQKYNNENISIYDISLGLIGEKSHYLPVIIIDEPENSLHPPYVSALLKILNIFCKVNMYGCIIMATHSPVVVQEFTSDMVRIVERAPATEAKSVFKRPDFETYGENIGILTDRIFGRDPLNTGFRQTLKDIVNSLPKNELFSPEVREKYIYPQIGVTSLGMEASMVLNGLISSRRKNIELKEKNSEDSR